VAMATGPAEVAADASCQAVVALDGTSSSDPDGDTLSYSWTGPLGTATGARATLPLPLGTNVVSLTVDDGYGMTASTTITVTVRASPGVLWPPNHKLVPVAVRVSATDLGGTPSCRITALTNDETGTADAFVRGPLAAELLAEREGAGDGRVYTIAVACSDASG